MDRGCHRADVMAFFSNTMEALLLVNKFLLSSSAAPHSEWGMIHALQSADCAKLLK